MYKTMAALAATLCCAVTNAALIFTMTETTSGGVDLAIEASGEFDGSISLNHLQYVFFDDLGDYVNDAVVSSNNPTFMRPVYHPQIGENINLQIVGYDNDTGNDPDDFFIRFIGTDPGLSEGDSLGGAFDLLSSGPFWIDAEFAWFNEGVYFTNTGAARAFGGVELRVEALQQVPLPAAAWMFAAALGTLGVTGRRRAGAPVR